MSNNSYSAQQAAYIAQMQAAATQGQRYPHPMMGQSGSYAGQQQYHSGYPYSQQPQISSTTSPHPSVDERRAQLAIALYLQHDPLSGPYYHWVLLCAPESPEHPQQRVDFFGPETYMYEISNVDKATGAKMREWKLWARKGGLAASSSLCGFLRLDMTTSQGTLPLSIADVENYIQENGSSEENFDRTMHPERKWSCASFVMKLVDLFATLGFLRLPPDVTPYSLYNHVCVKGAYLEHMKKQAHGRPGDLTL